MRAGFFPKLAADGIRKNKQLYVPYLLSCTGMVMMNYILAFLSTSESIAGLHGGVMVGSILNLGMFVMIVFSVLFLMYTNSFLMRRRRREFGLYNILGMGKWSIARILFWETVLLSALSLAGGVALGIGLSKVFELGLTNLLGESVNYRFTVSIDSVGDICLYFGIIFVLLYLKNLWSVAVNDPLALLRSENTGERPPKGSILLTLAGLALLGCAYYIAITVADPVDALMWFFVAVCMVILGTYLLFITGSVKLCRVLQKRKNYYYKTSHFVSVSTMAFRMGRNGAGLASICILLTMVLVMISTTTCAFLGTEEAMHALYPRDIQATVRFQSTGDMMKQEKAEGLRQSYENFWTDKSIPMEHRMDYRASSFWAGLDGSRLERNDADGTLKPVTVSVIPLEDYNQVTGANRELEEDEILLGVHRARYNESTLTFFGGKTYRVVRERALDQWKDGEAAVIMSSALFLVVPDLEAFVEPIQDMTYHSGSKILRNVWYFGFDTSLPVEQELELFQQFRAEYEKKYDFEWIDMIHFESREENRSEMAGLYGGLFFLGIVLSLVFLAGTVLIMYYKQVSEGYEDQGRFEIMKKVGMTHRDIRRTINSQMLTVFFLPLLAAGIHLCFAFPMVQRILLLMSIGNVPLLIACTVGCFGIFGVFYALVYRATSNTYYKIVSG